MNAPPETTCNLAVRLFYDFSVAERIERSRAELSDVPDAAANALRVWAAQRDVAPDAVAGHARTVRYDGLAVYCFTFLERTGYRGVVCVAEDGTFIGEDSSISS